MILGFDADDTLWENEKNYRETEEEVIRLLRPWYQGDNFGEEMYKREMSNLELFGYGAKGFTLSLLETALHVSRNQVSGEVIERIIALGKELITRPVVLLEGTRETLTALVKDGHRLLYITKGDLLDQNRKLDNSGLRRFFTHVEVMSGKTVSNYKDLFARLDIDPRSFVMVGDSLKSDILPVRALGGWGVYIPGNSQWQHEQVDERVSDDRFVSVQGIQDVISVVEKMEKKTPDSTEPAVRIYTDGGCLGNPGPGGWGFILSYGSVEVRKSGGEGHTTNNKMELTAVIKALKHLSTAGIAEGSTVEVYTDSMYVKNGITSWVHTWVRNGWKTASKQPVKNRELWMQLKELAERYNVLWKWVKGHAGDPLNEACDAMVREEMKKFGR